jgi:hypothetical protein
MSNSVRTIAFGHIGEAPVILTSDGGFILRAGNKRWSRLRDQDRSKVVQIRHSTFIRRFGKVAERLPIALRQSISQLRVDGQLVALSRTIQREGFVGGEGELGAAPVISMQAHRDRIERLKSIFNLGRHTYSGAPGFSCTCDYRIERLNNDGTLWDILATDEETGEYQSMGSHSLETAQEYFDSVYFDISRDQWEAMGATFPIEEDEDDYEEFENEADDEPVCVD